MSPNDTSPPDVHPAVASANPKWQPIGAIDRRVLGVLIEKAKTTPDAYPLSPNALKNGCNQKSNRFPQMDLDESDVEDAMERLRLVGAACVIQGGHRVDKMRHLAYDWFGIDKTEIAVMAELLLRGPQTLGELRARAARMEPIPGLAELRPIIARLVEKNLVVYLTPPGRGAVISHNVYFEREMEKLCREHGGASPPSVGRHEPIQSGRPLTESVQNVPVSDLPHSQDSGNAMAPQRNDLSGPLKELREELTATKMELAEFRKETQISINALRSDLDDLNRALGNL